MFLFEIGRERFELSCHFWRGILSPLRLPFRHRPVTSVILPLRVSPVKLHYHVLPPPNSGDQASPLSAGTVAIADRKALLDPANLFKCIAPNVGPRAQVVKIEPCTASYTLSRDGNEFYILYAGTTLEICQAFCANLDGCTAHKP